MPQTETEISKTIGEYLTRAGYFNLRLASGGFKQGKAFVHLCKPGTPDRYALIAGKSVFIEVKKSDGKVSAEQRTVHDEITRGGGSVIVAYSFDDFLSKLTKLKEQVK